MVEKRGNQLGLPHKKIITVVGEMALEIVAF